jgi:Dolichyl-phosphate-mannose-protein mannosyltransferase
MSTDLYSALMSWSAEVYGWAAIAVSLLVVLYCGRKDQRIVWPLFAGWLLRVLFCVYNTYINTLPIDPFEQFAYDLSRYPLAQILGAFGVNSQFYTWLCALLYCAIGRSPLALQAINIALWSVTAWNVYRITRDASSAKAGRTVVWILSLFPESIIFSTMVTREALCVFAIISGVYYWTLSLQRHPVRNGILSCACFVLAAVTHYGCVVLLLGFVAAPVLYFVGSSDRPRRRVFSAVILLCLSIALLGVLSEGGLFGTIAPEFGFENVTGADLIQEFTPVGDARAAYLTTLVPKSPVDVIEQFPIRLLFFLFTPFPWMIRSITDVGGFVDALFYWTTFYLLFKHRRAWFHDGRLAGCIVYVALGVAVFSMGTTNYGTAIRHRGKFFPIAIAVAAAGVSIDGSRARSLGGARQWRVSAGRSRSQPQWAASRATWTDNAGRSASGEPRRRGR